jgi:hypothetical protein
MATRKVAKPPAKPNSIQWLNDSKVTLNRRVK